MVNPTDKLTVLIPTNTMVALITIGILTIVTTHLTSLYIGWSMGRVQVVERIVVPAPKVEVGEAQVTLEQGSSTVTIEPPKTLIVTPPAINEVSKVTDERILKEFDKVYSTLQSTTQLEKETFDKMWANFERVYEKLQQITGAVAQNRAAIFSMGIPEKKDGPVTTDSMHERDEHGKLLPKPKEVE